MAARFDPTRRNDRPHAAGRLEDDEIGGSRLGTFERRDRPHLPRLVVDGDIDDRLVDDFTDAIFKTIVDAHGGAVIDLTGVTYFGANGVGVLITADALAHDHGVDLTIQPSRIVRRVLEIADLSTFLGTSRDD